MPQKNIYIREADKDVWDKAEELAGSASFSQLITDLLRDHVEQQKHKRIEFEFEDDTGRKRKRAFKGHWVIDFNDDVHPEGWDYQYRVVAAITARGGIFIGNYERGYHYLNGYEIYEALDAAELADEPPEVLAAVAAELGEDFVEMLDI